MTIIDFIELVRMLTVKVVAWLGLGIAAGMMVLCFGWWPSFHPGFERVDLHKMDMERVEMEIAGIHSYQDRHQALDDAKSILQLKAQECGLPKNTPIDVYRDTILGLNDECKRLGGAACDIPACGNL